MWRPWGVGQGPPKWQRHRRQALCGPGWGLLGEVGVRQVRREWHGAWIWKTGGSTSTHRKFILKNHFCAVSFLFFCSEQEFDKQISFALVGIETLSYGPVAQLLPMRGFISNIWRKCEHSESQVVSQISEVANNMTNMITFDGALINSPSPALIWGRSLGGTSGGEVPVWISSSPRSSICSPTSCSTSGRSPAGWTSSPLSSSNRGALSSTRSQSWSWVATVGHE